MLRDGVWSLIFNLLSKTQSVATLIAASIIGGVDAIGVITTALGAGLLGSTIVDLGYSSEVGRFIARHPNLDAVHRGLLGLAWRALGAGALAPLVFYLSLGRRTEQSLCLYLGVALYAIATQFSLTLANVLYGLSQFKSVSGYLGGARVATVAGSILLAFVFKTPATVLLVYALGETIPAIIMCSFALRRASKTATMNRLSRSHYWLGVGGIVNNLINQSDVLVVAALVNSTALGVFGVASQLQNGVATLALSAAAPMTVHVARADAAGEEIDGLVARARRATFQISTALVVTVSLAYLAAAVTRYLGEELSAASSITTVLISLAAAVPSAVAAVYLATAIGLRKYSAVGIVRIVNGVVTLFAFYVLSKNFGVVGAGLATVVRDASLLAMIVCLMRKDGRTRRKTDEAPARNSSDPNVYRREFL